MSVNTENTTSHTENAPHIPTLQGEHLYGPITTTTITLIIFSILTIIFAIVAKASLKKEKSYIKQALLNIVGFFDRELTSNFEDKTFARRYFPLIVGIFFIILFGNLFGLIIDWIGTITPTTLHYLRPIHSDLNTTLVLGMITVVMFLAIAIKHRGAISTAKGYFFNFTGHSIGEKIINVFVGWLHLIGVPSTLASLSLRLFGNIFAGIILIGVIGFLGSLMTANLFQVGKFLTIPFWFFEVFVAGVQAIVFTMLMIAYFGQSKEEHH